LSISTFFSCIPKAIKTALVFSMSGTLEEYVREPSFSYERMMVPFSSTRSEIVKEYPDCSTIFSVTTSWGSEAKAGMNIEKRIARESIQDNNFFINSPQN